MLPKLKQNQDRMSRLVGSLAPPIQHPTPNIQRTSELSIFSAFDAACFPLVQGFNGRKVSENSLPEGEGRGERELGIRLSNASNDQAFCGRRFRICSSTFAVIRCARRSGPWGAV